MSKHDHADWETSAVDFERKMLETMSFANSSAVDDLLYTLDEDWGKPEVDGRKVDQAYPTQKSVLAYAKLVHELARKFLAEQEQLAASVGDQATNVAADDKKRPQTSGTDAGDAVPGTVPKKCKGAV